MSDTAAATALGLFPRRTAVFAVGLVSAGLALGGARLAIRGYARGLTERSGQTVAAYVALATRAAPGGADYDLGQLLIRARALETLPDWTPEIEIYHATAPLIHATAPPLAPGELRRIREDPAARWRNGAALVPLRDTSDQEIVGAVEVREARLGPRWPGGWGLPAALVALGFAVWALRAGQRGARAQLWAYRAQWAGGVLLGIGAYADVRIAARQATDRWLTDTRALVVEAARLPERPGLPDLARVARGGTLLAADSGAVEPVRRSFADGGGAALRVRLGTGRWAELRVKAEEDASATWLLWTLGLGLLGPAVASGARRTRSARRQPIPDGAG